MNKKFSTLMAGLMLASAFSVANADVNSTPNGKYENGKYYLLGDGTNFISVVSNPDGVGTTAYGDLEIVTASDLQGVAGDNKLTETREALWKVNVTTGTQGQAPRYTFQNVATGLMLSVPVPAGANGASGEAEISGTMMEWYNGTASTGIPTSGNPLMSYVGANQVVYFVNNSGTLEVVKNTPSAVSGALSVQPYTATVINDLTAAQLNQELDPYVDPDKSYFSLSFNRDVTDDASTNLFAATELKAEQVPGTTYVRLQAKDVKVDDAQAYIVVDTAYYAGSENIAKLVKFTYAADNEVAKHPNGIMRYEKSFEYNFSYDPTQDRLLIRSHGYLLQREDASGNPDPVSIDATNPLAYDDYEYTRYTAWGVAADGGTTVAEGTNITATPAPLAIVSDDNNAAAPFVRLVELSSVRELTVSNIPGKVEEVNDPDKGMNTIVKIGIQNVYEPTTIADGLYLIRLVENDVRTKIAEDASEGDYYIANLGGAFGYVEQARNQDFQHMPAAQWYVEKQGTSSTAPVTITNREFSDRGLNGNLQAFKSGDNVFFTVNNFTYNGSRDTLEFIKVDNPTDAHMGYKYVTKEQASVETYVFNYLHGLSLENGLNTPSDKDSLVRVDETGAKAEFRLIPVVTDDSYGIQLDEKETGVANLVRNVYYIQAYDNSKFEGTRYLNYDKATKNYVMSKYAQPFFLKENNDIDGTHYYALVEANLLGSQITLLNEDGEITGFAYGTVINNELYEYYDEDGEPIVMDDSENIAIYDYNDDNELTRLRINVMPTSPSLTETSLVGSDNKYALYNKTSNNDAQEGLWFSYYDEDNSQYDYAREGGYSTNYAYYRVSVDDNTLDLTIANIDDKWTQEIRVSAFEVATNDSPLYRRFNGAAPETYGTSANAPLNLKFFRFNNDAEYLFENYSSENAYRDGINDKSISFLGVNNAYQFEENETRSYTMYVDTAYVRNNTRMPQYLIAVKPEFVEGDTTLCDASTHQHATPEEALACEHTQIKVGFTRAMYLFNAQDSIDAANYDYQGKAAYGAQGYTRLAFKDAVHAGDTLYILNPGVTTDQLKATDLKDGDLFADKIFLGDNKHKNVVFSFRLIDSDNNRFLIESESEENGAAVLNKDLSNVSIAPMAGGWVKVQNGVPVIARYQDFNEAIAQADVFDVNDEIQYDAVDNEEIAVEGVSVVAGNGQVTIMGAAGKNVTITNILGKVIASQVIASDNATIAVPAGIVAVAVEGEAAVKAIVK